MLLVISAGTLFGQEAAYLDLRGVQPRINLQHPHTPPVCQGNTCSFSGGISTSVGCGASGLHEPRALKATILSLDRTSYTQGDQVEIEIKIENVGTAPVTFPWSPHLADFQSSDIAARFKYFSSYLDFTLAKPGQGGYQAVHIANLYGTADFPGSLVNLQPGEWLHLRAAFDLLLPDRGDQTEWEANVTLGLRAVEFVPRENGYGENITNDYPRVSSGPRVPVQIFRRDDAQESAAVAKKQN